jgi:hypothetical protein
LRTRQENQNDGKLAVAGMVHAQQVADLEYKPPIAQPAYEAGK